MAHMGVAGKFDALGAGGVERSHDLLRRSDGDGVVFVAVADPGQRYFVSRGLSSAPQVRRSTERDLAVRHVRHDCGSQRVPAATDRGHSGKALQRVHGPVPGAVAAHAEAGDVHTVDVDAVAGDDLVEQGAEHTPSSATARR